MYVLRLRSIRSVSVRNGLLQRDVMAFAACFSSVHQILRANFRSLRREVSRAKVINSNN